MPEWCQMVLLAVYGLIWLGIGIVIGSRTAATEEERLDGESERISRAMAEGYHRAIVELRYMAGRGGDGDDDGRGGDEGAAAGDAEGPAGAGEDPAGEG